MSSHAAFGFSLPRIRAPSRVSKSASFGQPRRVLKVFVRLAPGILSSSLGIILGSCWSVMFKGYKTLVEDRTLSSFRGCTSTLFPAIMEVDRACPKGKVFQPPSVSFHGCWSQARPRQGSPDARTKGLKQPANAVPVQTGLSKRSQH